MNEITKIMMVCCFTRICIFTICGILAIFFRNQWLIGLGVLLIFLVAPTVEGKIKEEKEGEKDGKSRSNN